MNRLMELLEDGKNVVLLGHIHPDGDCVGSCLGLYNYLEENYPLLKVDLYLDHPAEKFGYLKNFSQIKTQVEEGKSYDLCISLDSSDTERLGEFVVYFDSASMTFGIDHHVTNQGFAMENYIKAGLSSTGEVLYGLLEDDKISREVAECLYTGIIHDTGVFKHSNTSPETMYVAGKLIAKGVDCSRIIDDSFYKKTYVQNQILGRALIESILFMDGRCIFSALSRKVMDFYGADSNDMDGIIDQLRITDGVEVAIFLYEIKSHEYKVSMRANGNVDVSKIASFFGGGGHVKAAGCTMSGRVNDVINNLSEHIENQLNKEQK